MSGLLSGGIAEIVGSALKSVFLDATLTREEMLPGPNDWTPGAAASTAFKCKAIAENFGAYSSANGLVGQGEMKILILATSLSVEPKGGDTIAIAGWPDFTIVSDGASAPAVSTDPARAVWVCRGKA